MVLFIPFLFILSLSLPYPYSSFFSSFFSTIFFPHDFLFFRSSSPRHLANYRHSQAPANSDNLWWAPSSSLPYPLFLFDHRFGFKPILIILSFSALCFYFSWFWLNFVVGALWVQGKLALTSFIFFISRVLSLFYELGSLKYSCGSELKTFWCFSFHLRIRWFCDIWY